MGNGKDTDTNVIYRLPEVLQDANIKKLKLQLLDGHKAKKK